MGDDLPEHIRHGIHKLIADSAAANRVQAYGSTATRPRKAAPTARKEIAPGDRKQGIRRPQTASPARGLGSLGDNRVAARSLEGVAASHGNQPAEKLSVHAKWHEPVATTTSPRRCSKRGSVNSPKHAIERAKEIALGRVEKDLSMLSSTTPGEQHPSILSMHGMQDALLRESYNSTLLALKAEVKEGNEARLHLQDQLQMCQSRLSSAKKNFDNQRGGYEARLAEEALDKKHLAEKSLKEANARLAECAALQEEKESLLSKYLTLQAAHSSIHNVHAQELLAVQEDNHKLQVQTEAFSTDLSQLNSKNGALQQRIKELEEEVENAKAENQYVFAQSHDFEENGRLEKERFTAKLERMREKRASAVKWMIRIREGSLLESAFVRWNVVKAEARLLFAVWTADAQKTQADARGSEVEELTQQLQQMSQQSNAELEDMRQQLEHLSQPFSTSRTLDQMSQQTTVDFGSRFRKDSDSISAPSTSEAASHPRAPHLTPPSLTLSPSEAHYSPDVSQDGPRPTSAPPPVQVALAAQSIASAAGHVSSGAEYALSPAPASQRSCLSSDTLGWQDQHVQGMELEEESWSRHDACGSDAHDASEPGQLLFLQADANKRASQAEGGERTGRVLSGLERSREGLSMLQHELSSLSMSVREELVDVYLKYAAALRALGQLKKARKMYERVLQIREMEQGSDNQVKLTPIWIKAGWLSFYLCDLDSALAFFSKAHKKLAEELGEEHEDAKRVERNLKRTQRAKKADLYHHCEPLPAHVCPGTS